MAGSLTLGGMAAGLPIGSLNVGPSTITGKANIAEIINVELVANVDTVIKVPPEAVAFAILFASLTPGQEVKVRTNLNNADAGTPLAAQGFYAQALFAGSTELKLKSTGAPPSFQVTFV